MQYKLVILYCIGRLLTHILCRLRKNTRTTDLGKQQVSHSVVVYRIIGFFNEILPNCQMDFIGFHTKFWFGIPHTKILATILALTSHQWKAMGSGPSLWPCWVFYNRCTFSNLSRSVVELARSCYFPLLSYLLSWAWLKGGSPTRCAGQDKWS